MAGRKLSKQQLRERGDKIAESHALRNQIREQFPAGSLVRYKQYPDTAGIVIGEPKVIRIDKYRIIPSAWVDVLWMKHPFMPEGEITPVKAQYLLHKKSS